MQLMQLNPKDGAAGVHGQDVRARVAEDRWRGQENVSDRSPNVREKPALKPRNATQKCAVSFVKLVSVQNKTIDWEMSDLITRKSMPTKIVNKSIYFYAIY